MVTDLLTQDERHAKAQITAIRAEHVAAGSVLRGRFGWEGPAVRVDDLQDALGATKVECQVEPMGRGYIVYPRTYPHRADVDRWVRPLGGGLAYPILRRERDA